MEDLVQQPSKQMEKIQECMEFINDSPTPFQAVENIAKQLKKAGFQHLQESTSWQLEKGGCYYVTRNSSSIVAFSIGQKVEQLSFNLCASHNDVCTFKIKPNAVLNKNGYVQLNTEGYGGMLCSTWMDRPLSIAGRIMVEEGQFIRQKLFDLKQPCCLIPNVAIHMNRGANEEMKFNKQIDMLPLIGLDQKEFDFHQFLALKLNLNAKEISYFDAYLYPAQTCMVWGQQTEFLSGPRLDDLEMAYATLAGFLESENQRSVNVYCCFDNEEVGSRTRQGAASTFLFEVLQRINDGLRKSSTDFYEALARSFMVSCDNAHALHPNHPEKSDETNRPLLNQGIVLKFNAAQSYTSDAYSAAYFTALCKKAGVKVQSFTNRSDATGGGTLGNVSTTQVSIASVDIGLAQLAMHSTYETAGTFDLLDCIAAMKTFFSHTVCYAENGDFILTN